MRTPITLTTDFGEHSGYAAQIKGVILSICRETEIVDISHAIRPQDIRHAAILLADVTPRFPPQTIHVAVIDPGVGTNRRILYAEINDQRYIAPDNGLLSYLSFTASPTRVISLENPACWLPNPSSTFHGRDIMAPAAAHLVRGLDPRDLGPPAENIVQLPWPIPRRRGSQVTGEVLLVDSFGNLITNIRRTDLSSISQNPVLTIELVSHRIPGIHPTYGSAQSGQLIALFDSQDRLEIAQTNGNAAATLNAAAGVLVNVSVG